LPTSTSAATLLILFIILLLNLFLITPNAVTIASNPQSLLSGERGEVVNDWVATFSWMRDNLPEGTVVASWWDYGYWIRVLGGKVNVADNANYNFTQINLIAKALVSPENESIKIFRQLNASYVLVYEQFFNVGGMWIPIGGDLEKSYWMIRIAFNYDDATVRRLYLNQTQVNIGFQNIFLSLPTGEKGKQALIYKLIFYKIPGLRERYPQQIEDLKIGTPIYFTLVYHSPNGYVMVYKINYPEKARG
jgi:dolichyl-diphosphooligosaccharide--protein glycosyltransferase